MSSGRWEQLPLPFHHLDSKQAGVRGQRDAHPGPKLDELDEAVQRLIRAVDGNAIHLTAGLLWTTSVSSHGNIAAEAEPDQERSDACGATQMWTDDPPEKGGGGGGEAIEVRGV